MEVASISGHKTLSQLKRYTHLKAEDLALPDLEAQVMENGPAAPDHRRVVQGE